MGDPAVTRTSPVASRLEYLLPVFRDFARSEGAGAMLSPADTWVGRVRDSTMMMVMVMVMMMMMMAEACSRAG